jgi:ubiquinone/menaquinone biosynthesis C-methylase UbiE
MNHNAKQKVVENFSKNASEYVTSKLHAEGKDLEVMIDWVKPKKTWIALDIATGGGHVAKALAPYVKQVFATDITKKMLETAADHLHEYSNVFYCLADAENLPFLNASFDLVTCRIAAHHFPNQEKFIQEVSRVLKPNGKFIFIDNVAPENEHLIEYMNTFEKLRDSSHVKCLSVEQWKNLMSQHHLHVLQTRMAKKTYSFQNWVNRMLESNEDIEKVENYILAGDTEQKNYFEVKIENGKVNSLKVDDAMFLCEKLC